MNTKVEFRNEDTKIPSTFENIDLTRIKLYDKTVIIV